MRLQPLKWPSTKESAIAPAAEGAINATLADG